MSLTLSKQSFIYRMTENAWDIFGITPSKSLCGFFWQMVLSPFIILGGIIISLAAVCAILWLFLYAIGGLSMTLLEPLLPNSWFLLKGEFNWRYIIASLIFWTGIISIIASRVYYNYRKEIKIEEGTYKPSVVVEFVRAKKRKICPFIEFK